MNEKEKEQNAIIAANMPINGGGIEIRTLQDAKLIAETFISAGLVPKSFNTPAKIIVAIQAGAELGLQMFQALNNLQVINGQVGLSAKLMAALIRRNGKIKYMKDCFEGESGDDDYKCIVESQREGDESVHKTSFSVAEAKQAGLIGKDNWKNYLEDMLWSRAMSRHARRYYSDMTLGLYSVEELHEIRPPDQQPTTEVLSREDRKQVENAVVTDSKDLIRERLTFLVQMIIDYAMLENNAKLYPDTDKDQLLSILDTFAVEVLHPEGGDGIPNYRDSNNFTVEILEILIKHLNENGLTPEAYKLVPEPFKTGKEEPETNKTSLITNDDLFEEKPKSKKKAKK